MKKIFPALLIAVLALGGLYYYYGDAIPPNPFKDSINDRIDEALLSAPVDVSEFGGSMVTLKNGEATFSAGKDSKNGFVKLGTPRAVVVKGDDADVLVLLNINGGGSGTFQYLAHYEFVGSEQKVHEVEKIMLGDRIIVDAIATEVTSPTDYDVIVSIKDRKENEPMSTTPSMQEALNFSRSNGKLALTAVIFGTLDQHDVVLVSPLPRSTISNSFAVKGAVRGTWYFEASFPVQLKSPKGIVLAQSPAQAQSDWMTTELVPFTASLVAPSTYHGPATLVIKNDNPSGDPAREKSIEVPVNIK